MRIAKELLKEAGVRVVSESITRQALIKGFSDNLKSFTDGSGNIHWHCSLTAFSEELAVFLGQNDIRFLADLTDLYDSADDWTYETKGQGIHSIHGVCFNLLGGTAPDWLVSILPQEAIGGGFTSRVIFVVEENKRKSVPVPFLTEEEKELKEELIKELERIKTFKGEYKFTREAMEFYVDWYKKQENNPPIRDPRFSGYCERRSTHLRKVSILSAASRGSQGVIEITDLERSLSMLEMIEPKMPLAFKGLGKSRYAEATSTVISYLERRRNVSKSEMLRDLYKDVDEWTLGIVMKTLSSMKIVKTILKGGEVYYEYSPKDRTSGS